MKPSMILAGILLAANAVAAPTPTRNVVTFTGLENELLDAVQKKDSAALNKIIADRFELRTSAAPGVPTARAESLKEWQQLAPSQSSIGQMAVHEYGDLMVVSFLWKIDAPKESMLPQEVFVVDTWKRAEGNWQLFVRYASPVQGTELKVPGAVAPSAQSLRKKI
jgi:ketosteroid isomerase-like protein